MLWSLPDLYTLTFPWMILVAPKFCSQLHKVGPEPIVINEMKWGPRNGGKYRCIWGYNLYKWSYGRLLITDRGDILYLRYRDGSISAWFSSFRGLDQAVHSVGTPSSKGHGTEAIRCHVQEMNWWWGGLRIGVAITASDSPQMTYPLMDSRTHFGWLGFALLNARGFCPQGSKLMK